MSDEGAIPPGAADAFVAFLPVRDLERSRTFYGETLGLELARDQGSCLIYRVAPGGYLGLCESRDGTTATHPQLIATIVTDDVDEVYARLTAAGAETEGPPRDTPEYRIRHLFARDPDGYRLEVQRFWEPLD